MKKVIICISIVISLFLTGCRTVRTEKEVREDLADYLDEYSNEYLLVGTDRMESFTVLEQTEVDGKYIYEIQVSVNRLGYWFDEYYKLTYDNESIGEPDKIEKINEDGTPNLD